MSLNSVCMCVYIVFKYIQCAGINYRCRPVIAKGDIEKTLYFSNSLFGCTFESPG